MLLGIWARPRAQFPWAPRLSSTRRVLPRCSTCRRRGSSRRRARIASRTCGSAAYVRFDAAELQAWWLSRRRGPWRAAGTAAEAAHAGASRSQSSGSRSRFRRKSSRLADRARRQQCEWDHDGSRSTESAEDRSATLPRRLNPDEREGSGWLDRNTTGQSISSRRLPVDSAQARLRGLPTRADRRPEMASRRSYGTGCCSSIRPSAGRETWYGHWRTPDGRRQAQDRPRATARQPRRAHPHPGRGQAARADGRAPGHAARVGERLDDRRGRPPLPRARRAPGPQALDRAEHRERGPRAPGAVLRRQRARRDHAART